MSCKKIIFSNKQLLDIKNQYLNGISSVQLGKQYGVSHKKILRELHKMGVAVNRSLSTRKYQVDESFFDNIDTPEKAYVLGLLWADGHNSVQKSTLTISLQEEDVNILEQIRNLLKSEKPLEYLDYSNKHDYGYHYKNQYRLLVFSSHVCKTLENLGMFSNKSLILTFPNIDSSLYSHFIRGYYDGDGSITRQIKNKNNHAIILTITSTESFCQKLKQICYEELGLNISYYDASCHNGITKVFVISGRNKVKVFLDWIYKDSSICLKRKYDRYCEYYNINNSLIA